VPILNVKDLDMSFGGLMALNRLNLSIEPGEIRGLIGPNGAGKTTLINIITGIFKPDKGEIEFQDKNFTGLPSYQIAMKGIARTFQTAEPFKNMTVLQNVMCGQHSRTKSSIIDSILRLRKERQEEELVRKKAMEVIQLVGLAGLEERLADSLAFAQARLMELARALATEPILLLLDEPAAGMNVGEVEELHRLLRKVRDEFGKTILLIEHNLSFVMKSCSRISVLDSGAKIAEGSAKEISNDPRVIEAYIGKGETSLSNGDQASEG